MAFFKAGKAPIEQVVLICCGEQFVVDPSQDKQKCPKCGKELKLPDYAGVNRG